MGYEAQVKRHLPLALLILATIITRIALWAAIPNPCEDAWITFRYAANLVAGNGLVYNVGERVMGFTSPLWTLWIAAGMSLHADVVTWVRATSLVCDLVTLTLGVALFAEAAGSASAWAFGAFFALWPLFAASSVSGMECSAFLASIVVCAWGMRGRAAELLLATVALMRPEGIAVAMVLSLGATWRARAIAAGIFAAGVAALWAYYGSPIPQSLIAKATVYGTPGIMGGRQWWEWMLPFAFRRFPTTSEGAQFISASLVIAAGFAAGLPALWRAHRSRVTLAAAGCLLVWLGYSAVGVAFFWWYMVIPAVGVSMVVVMGFPRIARGPWLPVAALAFLVGTWNMAGPFYAGRARVEASQFGPLARYLGEYARPGESIMLEPIGVVGYLSALRVIDEVGLVSPEVARQRRLGAGWYADIIERERPDWLIVRRSMLEGGSGFAGVGAPFRSLAERDGVLARYGTPPGSRGVSEGFLVLRRRG